MDTNSNIRTGMRRLINQRIFPSFSGRLDSSKAIAIWPKLKKGIVKTVDSKIAFGKLLTMLKKSRQKTEAITTKKSKGRRIIFVVSTSRRFQVRRARLG
jgi:hypothetical protein